MGNVTKFPGPRKRPAPGLNRAELASLIAAREQVLRLRDKCGKGTATAAHLEVSYFTLTAAISAAIDYGAEDAGGDRHD